jgi:AraC-like DNA-binding protein
MSEAAHAPDPAAPRYTEIAPSPALAPWVECYWSIRALDAPTVPNRVLPDGCVDLIVGIADLPRPVVVGTMRTAVLFPLAGRVDLFGVRFHPGGARPFLDLPLGELTDRRIPLDALWGPGADRLVDACEPPGLGTRMARVEEVLRHRLRVRARAGDADQTLAARAVMLLRRARGGVSVRQTAAALGVGERRLERAFGHAVGLGPKSLARVLRFRHAVRRIESGGPPGSWAAAAGVAGYADQSHMIREFKALAGVTPVQYAAERRAVGFVQYGQGEPE